MSSIAQQNITSNPTISLNNNSSSQNVLENNRTAEQSNVPKERAWQRLKQGDKVLVVAPSWAISWDREEREQYLDLVRELIEGKLGLTAVIPDSLLDEPFDGNYANTTSARAKNAALTTKNSDIKLIYYLHGGFGALESEREFAKWRKENPDMLLDGIPAIGFSDITVVNLHQGPSLSTKDERGRDIHVSGVTSPIHGPTLMHMIPKLGGNKSTPNRDAAIERRIKDFKEIFIEGKTSEGIKTHNNRDTLHYDIVALNDTAKSGKSFKGTTIGGHTNRITCSFGTDWEIGKNHTGVGYDKIILTIESDDVPEVAQFLKHIKNTSVWSKVNAVVIGNIVPLEYRFGKARKQFYDPFTQRALADLAKQCKKPIFSNLPIGHATDNQFLPFYTKGVISVSKKDHTAQLAVDVFRTMEEVKKIHPACDTRPEDKFPLSRKEFMKSSKAFGDKVSLVDDIQLIPINHSAKATKSLDYINIVGGDLGEEQNQLGTPRQLDTDNKVVFFVADFRKPTKILTLAGDSSTSDHFSSLVKADVVRLMAHMNDASIFNNAKAIVIGDIVAPSDVSSKSHKYLKNFNAEIKIFLEENDIKIPVYRAKGHQFLPDRFHMNNMKIERTGKDNQSRLTTERLIEKNLEKPKSYTVHLGGA